MQSNTLNYLKLTVQWCNNKSNNNNNNFIS